MSYEVIMVIANNATRELEPLAEIAQCQTLQEAEELARDLNSQEDMPIDVFYMSVEREDEEDE